MLSLLQISSPSIKKSFLDEFSPETQTWIVPDIRSKFEIQNLLISKFGYFEDESVLRASEFWRRLLKRVDDSHHMVSRDFLKALVAEILIEKNVRGAGIENTVCDLLDQLVPIFLHPQGPELLLDLMEMQSRTWGRWETWYKLTQDVFLELQQKKVVTSSWIPALLQNHCVVHERPLLWERELFIDLGVQVKKTEMELIERISLNSLVKVFEPLVSYRGSFEFLFKPYDFLKEKISQKNIQTVSTNDKTKQHLKAWRFSGALAEVKQATSQVRQWLEQGVQPGKILLAATQIEDYWPLLEPFFLEEGIPCHKDITVRAHSLPSVADWISRLKLSCGRGMYGDLEASYFFDYQGEIRFEHFYSLFSQMISSDDLIRHDLVKKAFAQRYRPEDTLIRDEFLGVLLQFWKPEYETQALEAVLREFLQNASGNLHLKLSSWLFYLEQIVAKKEIRIRSGDLAGVQFANISSAESLFCEKRIFLGMAESRLKTAKKSLIPAEDVFYIAKDLGFFLDNKDISETEFEVRWISETDSCENHFYFPESNMSGSIETPSLFWLEISEGKIGKSQVCSETRWDQLQKQKELTNLWQTRNIQEAQGQRLYQQILADAGKGEDVPVKVSGTFSLSASSLERYLQCPFVFLAEKGFSLIDAPLVDVDTDHRTRGMLAHGLFERLTKEPVRYNLTDIQVREILEELRKELNLQFFDEYIWASQREKHVQVGLRFLKFEKAWKAQFPDMHILEKEFSFSFYADYINQQFTKDAPKGAGRAFKISGRIDRIEGNKKGQIAIVDYKSSHADLTHYGSWMKNQKWQLLLYSLAFDGDLIEKYKDQDVAAALYYVFKDFRRDKGLFLKEALGTVFSDVSSRAMITSEKKEELYKQFKESLFSTLSLIDGGHFPAKPLDKEQCPRCEWKNLCRASHLN